MPMPRTCDPDHLSAASSTIKKYKDMTKKSRGPSADVSPASHIAVIGAGIAGITCARTLMQAGHQVTVFEKSLGAGGRMATCDSEFGGFDHGAQYFHGA